MGFFLTLLYAALNHLSLVNMLPDLAPYRIFLWLSLLAVVVSLPTLLSNPASFRAPQVYLMLGLVFAIGMSNVAHLWFGGVLPAVGEFLSAAIVFFLVVVNANSLRRVRLLALMMVLVGFYLLARSMTAFYYGGDDVDVWVLRGSASADAAPEDYGNFARIRALGLLSDPNDFGQYLLVTLPFVAMAWRKGKRFRNLMVVVVPSSFVLYGIFLTHSRGAVIGLVAILLFALKRRLGTIRSLVAAATTFVLIIAPFGGSRSISASDPDTAGRLMAWGTGISVFKSSPIFGSGFESFLNFSDITAHNSFVLCFVELGLFGYFFWIGLSVFTMMDLNNVLQAGEDESNKDLLRWANAIRLSLIGFLASSWFLSRTYSTTLYLLLGMAVALVQLAKAQQPLTQATTKPGWWLTVQIQAASIILVYLMVKSRAF